MAEIEGTKGWALRLRPLAPFPPRQIGIISGGHIYPETNFYQVIGVSRDLPLLKEWVRREQHLSPHQNAQPERMTEQVMAKIEAGQYFRQDGPLAWFFPPRSYDVDDDDKGQTANDDKTKKTLEQYDSYQQVIDDSLWQEYTQTPGVFVISRANIPQGEQQETTDPAQWKLDVGKVPLPSETEKARYIDAEIIERDESKRRWESQCKKDRERRAKIQAGESPLVEEAAHEPAVRVYGYVLHLNSVYAQAESQCPEAVFCHYSDLRQWYENEKVPGGYCEYSWSQFSDGQRRYFKTFRKGSQIECCNPASTLVRLGEFNGGVRPVTNADAWKIWRQSDIFIK